MLTFNYVEMNPFVCPVLNCVNQNHQSANTRDRWMFSLRNRNFTLAAPMGNTGPYEKQKWEASNKRQNKIVPELWWLIELLDLLKTCFWSKYFWNFFHTRWKNARYFFFNLEDVSPFVGPLIPLWLLSLLLPNVMEHRSLLVVCFYFYQNLQVVPHGTKGTGPRFVTRPVYLRSQFRNNFNTVLL